MANSAPPEIMDEICQQLAAPELKSARLVCRSFNPVAEKHLFREILVKTNLSSFRKLAFISRHPTLCHQVRTVHYDGKLLPRTFANKHSWLHDGIGLINAPFGADPAEYMNVVEFQNQLSPVELEYHHMQYCAFLDSQDRLLGENEETWLADAFACFENLENVVYGETTKDCLLHRACQQKKSMDWRTMSTTAKETLIEPQNHVDIERNALSFAVLLEASSATPGRLKSIEACVTWRMFTLRPSNFAESVKTLRHLTLEISPLESTGQDSLAKVISIASMLQTLRLSFRTPAYLEGLLVYREHWPCLETFHTTRVRASEPVLRKFLGLCNSMLIGEFPRGSWVAMITFIQQNLNLKHIQFDGYLESGYECWIVPSQQWFEQHPDKMPKAILPFAQDCLRKRSNATYYMAGTVR